MNDKELKPAPKPEPEIGDRWYATRGGCPGVIKVEVIELTLVTIAIKELTDRWTTDTERYVKGYINFLEKLDDTAQAISGDDDTNTWYNSLAVKEDSSVIGRCV